VGSVKLIHGQHLMVDTFWKTSQVKMKTNDYKECDQILKIK